MSNKDYQFFADLHHQEEPLILYNCRNVSTAKLLEKAGQQMIAPSSYAIADSLEYQDGEKLPFKLLL